MFEDVIRQALKDMNRSAYNEMRKMGTLDQHVRELGALSGAAYRTIAGDNPTLNSRAMARELVIADIVAEVQKVPGYQLYPETRHRITPPYAAVLSKIEPAAETPFRTPGMRRTLEDMSLDELMDRLAEIVDDLNG